MATISLMKVDGSLKPLACVIGVILTKHVYQTGRRYMRTINSKNKQFVGFVSVNGEEVFVDTNDGTGFLEICVLMKPCINVLVKFGLSLNKYSTIEDTRQDIYAFMIDGILRYNPTRNASLSTFLYKFIKNKLIDQFRDNDPLKGNTKCIPILNAGLSDYYHNPINKVIETIDLVKCILNLDKKWRYIIFRIYINGEKVSEVASDENMTPWGLTRAIRRKIRS
jgi:DNA-directed RNA polymerase specialized sigma24 family protein